MINFKLQASGIPESIEQYQLALDAAFNAGKAIAGAAPVPEGRQIVPVEPTQEMLHGIWIGGKKSLHAAYKAMLAAAPKEPS